MNKKKFIFIFLVIVVTGLTAYFYLTRFYFEEDKYKIYTAKDFPNALESMTEDILEKSLIDLNHQYEELEKGDHIYIRWIHIGILKKRLKDYPGAEEAWLEAVEYNPEQYLAYGNLADFYLFNLSQYEKAEEFYKEVLTLNPNHYNY